MRSPSLAITALSISAFAIGTTEFVIMGLLPQVAGDLGVSISAAGLLVTAYALGVAVGAPIISALTNRIPRKTLLLGLMGLFVIGNVLCAIASSYGILMAARIVASFTHGSFFGVGSVVAAGLVAPDRRAKAVALMFTGLTIATIVGVPAGKMIGDAFGWRTTFWAVSAFGLVAMLAIARLVPPIRTGSSGNLRQELAVVFRPSVLLALGTTVFGFGGVFAAFTYIAPLLLDVTRAGETMVTVALLLFGIGVTIGNLWGGKIADRSLMSGLAAVMVALAAAMVLLGLVSNWLVPTLVMTFLLGIAAFATAPGLQTRVLDKAGDAPALAATLNIGAFNLGNALGAWLGGVAIDAGYGLPAASYAGAALALIGLAATLLGIVMDRMARRALAATASAAAC